MSQRPNSPSIAAEARCRAARRRVIRMSYEANSAHLGSSLSAIEILDAIFTTSDITPDTAGSPRRDRVIMSKGHAAMAYYATLETHSLVPSGDLDAYLNNGSRLWGHVSLTNGVAAIDASSGSLGHGLGIAAGFALANRLAGDDKHRVFAILSDGECDEGSTWEAVLFAGARRLDRLTAIVDYNHIQSIGTTHDVMELEPFADKWRVFGWEAVEVDGHDWLTLMEALAATTTGKPRVILAHTVKGKGIPRIENTVASHYKPALASDIAEA